jgi:hypothetical protein
MKLFLQSILQVEWSTMDTQLRCPLNLDNAFGPLIKGCRFDFTLYFEQLVLSSAPTLIFLLAFPLRTYLLVKKKRQTKSAPRGLVQIVKPPLKYSFPRLIKHIDHWSYAHHFSIGSCGAMDPLQFISYHSVGAICVVKLTCIGLHYASFIS